MNEKEKKMIATIIVCIIVVVLILGIFDDWNEMWYHFGENVYKWLHN